MTASSVHRQFVLQDVSGFVGHRLEQFAHLYQQRAEIQ
jgi:hypothetical protein